MILALYNFKLRLYSEISLENSITKDWVGEQGAKRSPCTAEATSSLPQVLRTAKLENQPSADRTRSKHDCLAWETSRTVGSL